MKHSALQIPLCLALAAAAVLFPRHDASAAAVNLGAASGFAVLAGSGITIGGSGMSTVTGDIGSSPTPSLTGIANLILTGTDYADSVPTQNAKAALTTAYNDAAGRPQDVTYVGGFDLVGLILTPGVYRDGSSLFLSGTLTLDAQGDPNAMWIFQAGSTLITASASKVVLLNGAQAANVFWAVGSSATLGTSSDFSGSILAVSSITLTAGATVNGQLLASDGAVTLDNNVVAVPEGSVFLLLGAGVVTLGVFRRWFAPRAPKASSARV